MPKNIVPSPTAAVAVDRLTLHVAGARDTGQGADALAVGISSHEMMISACSLAFCFSEE